MIPPQPAPAQGDQGLGPTINAVNWVFTILALLAVGARLYGRVKLTHNIGWDDLWIVVAIVRLSSFMHIPFPFWVLRESNADPQHPLRRP